MSPAESSSAGSRCDSARNADFEPTQPVFMADLWANFAWCSAVTAAQPRKAGPADDAATAAARDFLLGSDVAAQAIVGTQADGGVAAAAGAQLPQV